MCRGLVSLLVILVGCSVAGAVQTPRPTFRTNVDRVTAAATVRTQSGRLVPHLTAADFQLFDAGEPGTITEFRNEPTPVSLGLLVDFSGSMGVAARRQAARDAASYLVGALTPDSDEAALYAFDRVLREVQPMAPAPGEVIARLDAIARPSGTTSLFDAIAESGQRLAGTGGARRALIALTDGVDNASRLTAPEVSGLASSIDVPVYVIVIVSPFDRSGRSTFDNARLVDGMIQGPLGNLARWTGGDLHVSVGRAQTRDAARQIVSELRQQYLIGFVPDSHEGWHPIELRTRNPELVVRVRSGYIVQGNPDGL